MATLAELQQRLAAYQQAEQDVLLKGQSYEIPGPDGSRKFTRANLETLQGMIKVLEQDIAAASARESRRPRRRALVPFP
jgi:hypothetical protein